MIRRKTITQLNQEILDLKNCQVDMVKLALKLFTAVSLFISGIATAVVSFRGTDNQLLHNLTNLEVSLLLFPIIIIILITPISFPIFMRIIIHKCRSIFRMVGYIRLSEELEHKEQLIVPYEYGYGIIRRFPFLLNRIPAKKGIVYYFWDHLKELLPCRLKYTKLPGKKKRYQLKPVYIGRYYFNLGFFLALLLSIHLIIFGIISFLIITHMPLGFLKMAIGILDFYIFFWCWYNFMLLRRYFFEIHYYPFSIYSWYCLFKVVNAYYQNNNLNRLTSARFLVRYINYLTT